MAIAFLDFEASSLSPTSYPIEIGWAVAGAEAAESHLILPHPDWIDWDPAAQGVHGISRSQLFEHGLAGPAVLALMTRSLAGLVVYSDAPAEDGHWLDRLCMACGSPLPFQLQDAGTLFAHLAETAGRDLSAVQSAVAGQYPRPHRAGADAAFLKAIWTCLTNSGATSRE